MRLVANPDGTLTTEPTTIRYKKECDCKGASASMSCDGEPRLLAAWHEQHADGSVTIHYETCEACCNACGRPWRRVE